MLELAKYVKVGLAATSLYMLSAAAFLGATVDNELAFNVGWRLDTVERKFHDRNDLDISIHDKLKVEDANLWQIGVCGRFGAPDCFCDCGTEWLSNFYVRGYAYYGWYTDGKIKNRFHEVEGNSVSGRRHRKVNDGHASDYSIGIGYLFPVTCEFSIGPVGGYAWDEQVFKGKRRHHHRQSSSSFIPSSPSSSSPESSPSSSSPFFPSSPSSSSPSSSSPSSSSPSISGSPIEGLDLDNVVRSVGSSDGDSNRRHLKSRWRGGWVGFDAVYKLCDWDVAFGYEYHFAQFRGGHDRRDSSSLVPPPVSNSLVSNRRHHKGKNGHGHVAWIDGRWNLCDCWDLVVGFKYQNFESKRKAEWTAFGVTAGLGWRF